MLWKDKRGIHWITVLLLLVGLVSLNSPSIHAQTEIWPSGGSVTSPMAGTMTFSNGVTATMSLSSGSCANLLRFWDVATTTTNAGVNFPGTWYTPTPASTDQWTNIEIDGLNCNGATAGTITITFSKPVTGLKFHFQNMDASKWTFSATPTRVSGNNVFTLAGNVVHPTTVLAQNGGCQANDGTNPSGSCGTVSFSGTVSQITATLVDGQDVAARGDGMAFSMTVFDQPPLDSDNDGVPDLTDLDDDNDGILDLNECNAVYTPLSILGKTLYKNATAFTAQTKFAVNDVLRIANVGSYNGTTLDLLVKIQALSSGTSVDYRPSDGTFQFLNPDPKKGDNVQFTAQFVATGTNTVVTIPNLRMKAGDIDSEDDVDFTDVFSFQNDGVAYNVGSGVQAAGYLTGGVNTALFPNSYRMRRDLAGNSNNWVDEVNTANSDPAQTVSIVYTSFDVENFAFGVTGSSGVLINRGIVLDMFSYLSSCVDTDGDGIANSLDLDSDGDGCPDAIEGGAAFTAANLVASTLAGGNSGTGYTGTSTTPITQNLGNTVDANGIPTIAGVNGQTVGTSQDKAQKDAACCIDLAPALSATSKSNICPATTVDLSTITASNVPSGFTLGWFSGSPAMASNQVTSVTALGAGTYYAAFYNAASGCYGPTTPVTATVATCCVAGTTSPTLIKN